MKKSTLLISLIFFYILNTYADSDYNIVISEDIYFSSSDDYTTHYLESNNWGLVYSGGTQSVTSFDLDYAYFLNNSLSFEFGAVAGGSINSDSELFVNELYAQVNFMALSLFVGKKYTTMGSIPENLSGGSMTVSNNASPIPKVSLGMEDFTTIPYTLGLLQIKGNISHGWFQGDNYVDDILLHEKSIYGRIVTPIGLYPYAGLVHEAMWAGSIDGDNISDVSWANFWSVFFAESGGDDSLESDQINVIGNHLGAWEYGIYGAYDILDFQIYYQHFFEDGSGMDFQNEYDGLWGVNISPKKISYIDNFLFEFLYTKNQSGDTHNIGDLILGGLDSYYTNGIYKNDWTHLGSIIGNSFFTSSGEDENVEVVNNRMIVFNVGIDGIINDGYYYKSQVAYGRYFEGYSTNSIYKEGDYAWMLFGQLTQSNIIYEGLDITLALAYDFGTIEDTFGCLVSFNWKF